jgi:hypothetical protein
VPPDGLAESDHAFFAVRPWARHRIRAPFAGEFPDELLTQGNGRTAVVIVTIQRDASGATTRARGIAFIDGGHA